jgi:hypothetical protein
MKIFLLVGTTLILSSIFAAPKEKQAIVNDGVIVGALEYLKDDSNQSPANVVHLGAPTETEVNMFPAF